MELTPLEVAQIRAAMTTIQRILAKPRHPAPAPDAASLVQAWVAKNLTPDPGGRIDLRHIQDLFAIDTGINMAPQRFGMLVALPKQRSNGHTYITSVKLRESPPVTAPTRPAA